LFGGERLGLFSGIKIDGVLEASLSLVVTYDANRGAPHVLGRHAIADAGLYSVCLAIENLWLACVAEGWGMGWVSFYRESFVRELLGIPDWVRPVAWLCIGPVTHLESVPDLERAGWRTRLPLASVLHRDHYGERPGSAPTPTPAIEALGALFDGRERIGGGLVRAVGGAAARSGRIGPSRLRSTSVAAGSKPRCSMRAAMRR